MNNSDKIIKKLQMIPHPEGGHFKESYRDNNISLIYYLLKKNEKSLAHWHDGDPRHKKVTMKFFNKNELSHLVIKAELGLVWNLRENIINWLYCAAF